MSGTLLEGIALWGELKPLLTHEAVKERALAYCDWAVSMGLLAIRTHVDTCDDRLLAVEALLEVKKQVAPYIDLQLVAFPQDGFYRSPTARENTLRALDLGVDIVGGIPHFERTMDDGRRSVIELCEIAEQRGLMVDMHCDETDDPLSRHIEQLACETQRLGLQGRVAGSHLTSMHSMDNYYVSKLLPLIAEAQVAAIPNPLINIMLQGRHDTYPKRRGLTRVPEMLKHGIRVGWGQDCVLDPWYSLGTADMLDVAFMGLHVAQMSSPADMARCYDMVTNVNAAIMGLDHLGLGSGQARQPRGSGCRQSDRGAAAAGRAALRHFAGQSGGRARETCDETRDCRAAGNGRAPAPGVGGGFPDLVIPHRLHSLGHAAFDIPMAMKDLDNFNAFVRDAVQRQILSGDQMSDAWSDVVSRHPGIGMLGELLPAPLDRVEHPIGGVRIDRRDAGPDFDQVFVGAIGAYYRTARSAIAFKPAASLCFHFGHCGAGTCPAFDAFPHPPAQLFNGVAKQVAPFLPLPHGLADRLAGGGILAGIDGAPHEAGHFRRQRDGDFLDSAHSNLALSFAYGMRLAYRRASHWKAANYPKTRCI